jgi:hypothetical protein
MMNLLFIQVAKEILVRNMLLDRFFDAHSKKVRCSEFVAPFRLELLAFIGQLQEDHQSLAATSALGAIKRAGPDMGVRQCLSAR